MKSLIIIGKGLSALNCKKDFVYSHDYICIVNDLFFSEYYEQFIGFKADYQFITSQTASYSKEVFQKLGIKEIFFGGTHKQKFRKQPNYYDCKLTYPEPNLYQYILNKYQFDPSGGTKAFYYFLKSNQYHEISLVGFDFYQLGLQPYYYTAKEGSAHVKSLLKNTYKNYKVCQPSGHNSEKSINFIHKLILEYPKIKFNILSNNEDFTNLKCDNLNYYDFR